MKVSANYLDRQFTKERTEAILDDLRKLVESGDFTMGEPMREFERRFSELVGGRDVIAVNSGTEALLLALKTAGIGFGDTVIVQPNTFYADVGAIIAVGAKPLFCDVDASHQLDPAKIEKVMNRTTRAILPVWWYGTPPDWIALQEIAGRRGLLLIEDAAQAVGAGYAARPSGTFGDVAAFSFHPLKPLHVWGDGGAVVLPKGERADWLRTYRDHGKVSRDDIVMWGVNARLQTVQAIVANHEIDRVAVAVASRQAIAWYLDENLGKIPGVTIPPRRGLASWRTYAIEVDRRDELKAALIADGIEAAVHYPIPLHLQKPGLAMGYRQGDFPIAEAQAKRQITLPCHEHLTAEEIAYMLERVRAFYA
jgi:dTDP-4-amino-4,6-dideoxygalactose transaminase